MRHRAKAAVYRKKPAEASERDRRHFAVSIMTIRYLPTEGNHGLSRTAKSNAPSVGRVPVTLTALEWRHDDRIDPYFRHDCKHDTRYRISKT